MSQSSATLTSLALLKVHMDQRGEDYIEHFVPFVAACLRDAPTDVISIPEVQTALENSFGLNIPQGPLTTILKRAVRRGYAKRERQVYRRNLERLREVEVLDERNRWLDEFAHVVEQFIKYAEGRFNESPTRETAENALLRLVDEMTDAIADGDAYASVITRPDRVDADDAYMAHAFIADAVANDERVILEFWESVIQGSMIASSLLYPDVVGVQRKFDRVRVLLDTKFILRALGHCGPELHVAADEVLALLMSQSARLACFEDTLNEIQGVLDVTARMMSTARHRDGSHGETIEYFLHQGATKSDVELVIARLESDLHRLGVEIVERPPYEMALAVDEVGLEHAIEQEIRYQNADARQHDVDVLTAVHRLRKGKAVRSLETCRAIFVTTNTDLVRAAARHFKSEQRDRAVPPCISVHLMSTLVWLKSPHAAPDLPRKRIVADAFAAIRPSDELMKAYSREIARLRDQGAIHEDDYSLLKYSTVARRHLVDVTFNDVEGLTEGTIEQILERARRHVAEEKEHEITRERLGRLEAERRASEASRRMATQEAQRTAFIAARAQRVARLARRLTEVAVLVGLMVGSWFTLPFAGPDLNGSLELLVGVLGVAVLVVATVSLYQGGTVRGWLDRLEGNTDRVVIRWLHRWTEPAEEH